MAHRQGRSAPNVRVSSTVIPQSRVRGSAVEGKNVLVIGGEYRGLSGKIFPVFFIFILPFDVLNMTDPFCSR